jgi:transcriptional regulator with XRE-family HTH domain
VSFNRRLGEHLRRLRKQKGLSLLDVEAASAEEFKASVLGAYERGERAISASRLVRLAEIYRLPVQAMLPSVDGAEASPAVGLAIDLERLSQSEAPEAKTAARYVRHLQAQRGEWAGRVFRIRAEDVRALACACDVGPDDLVKTFETLGLRAY